MSLAAILDHMPLSMASFARVLLSEKLPPIRTGPSSAAATAEPAVSVQSNAFGPNMPAIVRVLSLGLVPEAYQEGFQDLVKTVACQSDVDLRRFVNARNCVASALYFCLHPPGAGMRLCVGSLGLGKSDPFYEFGA